MHLDRGGAKGFASCMATTPTRAPSESPPPHEPPLGSWARTYALVCLLAVAVMALLYWFTAHYQIRMGGA